MALELAIRFGRSSSKNYANALRLATRFCALPPLSKLRYALLLGTGTITRMLDLSLAGAMEIYANLAGNSGISEYEIGPGSITVRFKRGGTYLYGAARPGVENVAAMQELARAGQGLNTFINKHVRDYYEAKLE